MKKSTRSVFALFALILMPAHVGAAVNQATSGNNTSGDSIPSYSIPDYSIRFIALPYLNAFHIARGGQAVIISRADSRQNLSDYQWRISATSIPEYREESGTLQTLDTMQASGPRLAAYHNIIIPLPNLPGPVSAGGIAMQALWIQMLKKGVSMQSWQPPSLTPIAAAQALAEQQRKARLAKRMADRAFYFGYDTNNDALK